MTANPPAAPSLGVVEVLPHFLAVAGIKQWYCGETESQAYINRFYQMLACLNDGKMSLEGLDCFMLHSSREMHNSSVTHSHIFIHYWKVMWIIPLYHMMYLYFWSW